MREDVIYECGWGQRIFRTATRTRRSYGLSCLVYNSRDFLRSPASYFCQFFVRPVSLTLRVFFQERKPAAGRARKLVVFGGEQPEFDFTRGICVKR